jgi:hypothetical protein
VDELGEEDVGSPAGGDNPTEDRVGDVFHRSERVNGAWETIPEVLHG